MACSNCGAPGHRIQTCPTVRRCGHCHRPGHDRRSCPRLSGTPTAVAAVGPAREPPPPKHLSSDDPLWQHITNLGQRYSGETAVLAHLYWPEREHFFEKSRRRYEQGGPWRLKATPGHGVRAPSNRPTLNFFIVDGNWFDAYKMAAANRGLRHGLLVHRRSIAALERPPTFELADVEVGHPHSFGVDDPTRFWRYDIGNHRFKALHALRFSKVVRFATPEGDDAQTIDIPNAEVIAWW